MFRWTLILCILQFANSQRTLISGVACEIPFVFNGESYTDCFESGGREWCVATDGTFGLCRPKNPSPSSSFSDSSSNREEATSNTPLDPETTQNRSDSESENRQNSSEPKMEDALENCSDSESEENQNRSEPETEKSQNLKDSESEQNQNSSETKSEDTSENRTDSESAKTQNSSEPETEESRNLSDSESVKNQNSSESKTEDASENRFDFESDTTQNSSDSRAETSSGDCCTSLREIGFNSSLPVIIVNTDGEDIPDEPKITGKLCTCGGKNDLSSYVPIGIEIRGSTSARDFIKKSFGVETRDEQGADLDRSLLGFPEDSDWVFYGPEMDKTMGMRNYLTMELYRAGGGYSSRVQYFELFLVDDGLKLSQAHYNGLYVLMEKIKRGDDRVPIERLDEEEISGGYIFKYDNNNFDRGDQIFNSSTSRLAFIVTYPTKEKVEGASLDYLSAYIGEVEVALSGGNRSQWVEYINEDSFVDTFLITELTKNPDGYRGSFYFHKNPGQVLLAGPPWDYNEAYGMCCGYPIEGYLQEGVSNGQSEGSAISTNGWRYNICADQERCRVDPSDGVSSWFRVLMEDANFQSKVRRRWEELRAGPWSTSSVQSYFSTARNEISDSVQRNVDRWRRELSNKDQIISFSNWNDEMSMMENWVTARLEWLDSELLVRRRQNLAG